MFRSAVVCALTTALSDEPLSPTWPSTVKVFGPTDNETDIQNAVMAAFHVNGGSPNIGQFSSERFAFLFKPGSYNVDVPVGFYTQVSGLGTTPDQVQFNGDKGVYCEEADTAPKTGGALVTFWRIGENFQTNSAHNWIVASGMIWAVSQAAPLRSVIVKNELSLFEYIKGDYNAGFASGGFMANMKIGKATSSGSQQQFMTRNSDLGGGWKEGVWNMVYVGNNGAPASHCGIKGGGPYVTIDKTPKIAEKPFITIGDKDDYYLMVPPLRENTVGSTDASQGAKKIPFTKVYVADATKDTADSINKRLDEVGNVVLAPGVYNLTAPIVLNKPDQVLLGLGMATLEAVNGNVLVQVGNVPGVHVAGLLLQAGDGGRSPSLLQWGDKQNKYSGDATNPGIFHDVFARVGGPTHLKNPSAETMVEINSGNVIGDNMWFWRADHDAAGLTHPSDCQCNHGLVVNGDDVTMYGLAVEHTLNDLVLWNGDRGATYFYQSELPYGVNQSFGDAGYAGYHVADGVKAHKGIGVGVYSFMRDHPVTVESGIKCPPELESSFMYPLTVFLSGQGTIKHVINDKGNATTGPTCSQAWVCPEDLQAMPNSAIVV